MKTSAEHRVAFFKEINKSFDKLATFQPECFVLTRTDSDSSYRFLFLFQSAQSIDKESTYCNIYLESYSRWEKKMRK